VQQGITAVIFTWKEIVGSGIALVLGAIAIMQLPMFKTERQKQDELLTPDQRKRIAVLDTFCRGETPVGLDQPIAPDHRHIACRGRELIVNQATVRANPNWQQELALEVKTATDQHRECERVERKKQIEKEAARMKGEDESPAWYSRYDLCDREYNRAVFSANLKYGSNVPERSVRQ
jgi:hypothetical protein